MSDRSGVRVYVGGLDDKVSKDEVEKEFQRFGKLNNVWVAFNPPGFAFVEFSSMSEAEKAVDKLNGRDILGSKLRVEISRGRGRGGFRGSRGGDREYGHGRGDYSSRGGRGGYDRDRSGDSGFRGRSSFGRSSDRGGRRGRSSFRGGDHGGYRGGRRDEGDYDRSGRMFETASYDRGERYEAPRERGYDKYSNGYSRERERYDPYRAPAPAPTAPRYRSRSPVGHRSDGRGWAPTTRQLTPPPPRYSSRDPYPPKEAYRESYPPRQEYREMYREPVRDGYSTRVAAPTRDYYTSAPPRDNYRGSRDSYGSSSFRGRPSTRSHRSPPHRARY